MITLQDGIKYIGIAAVIYFLIKAFTQDQLDNSQIALLVVIIMALVIFIMNQQTTCPKQKENYQILQTPIVPSIYPGPQTEPPVETNQEVPKCNYKYVDKDIQDMKSIAGLNLKVYDELVENEQKAMDKIRSKFTNEMVYTDTHPFNTIPLGTQIYGYTYLPPENWFRAYERPPICATDKRCTVCPVTDGSTSDLLQFNAADNVMGPAGININYVKKVLNDGLSCS